MTMNSAGSHRPGLLAALSVAALGAGCSFLYDLNTTQCEFDKDCKDFGPQFENTKCINRVCVEVDGETGGGTGTGGSGEAGVSTGGSSGGSAGHDETGGQAGQETGGTGGSEPTGGSAGEPECAHNSECMTAHNDAPYVCRNGQCVRLMNSECPAVLPAEYKPLLEQDGAIVLGAFTTMGNAQDYTDTLACMNWELALNEFNTETEGGLPGYSVARDKRPLLMLVCQGLSDDVTPGIAHLGVDVGVSAVLSTISPDKLKAAFNYTQSDEYVEAGGKDIFFMSTSDATIAEANLDDKGLVWHELGDPRMLAGAVSALVERIEPYVNQKRAENFLETGEDNPDTEDLRVTLVYSDYETAEDMRNVLTTIDDKYPNSLLRFNDGEACTNQLDTNFRVVNIESSWVHTTGTPDVTNALASIADYPPHIIVAMATDEFADYVIPSVEDGWGEAGSASEGMQRPYYVLSHLVYNKLPTAQAVADQSRRTPPLGERLVGVNWASAQDEISKSLYGSYLDHLQNEYLGTTELSLPGSENFYDAAYHVLYSAAAAYQAEESPDGQDILDAFKSRVISTNPTAPVVNIGPLNIATTVTQVASAPGISLYATMGPPDFDRISGTRWTSMSAWCVQYNASAASYQFEADGLLYDWADHLYYDPESGPPACLADY